VIGTKLISRRDDALTKLDRLTSAARFVVSALARLHSTIVDGRPDAERPDGAGLELELPPRLIAGDDGRRLEADEPGFPLLRLADLEPDEVAGQERPEARDPAQRHARLDNEEPRVLHHQPGRALLDLGRHLDAREI